MSGKPFDIDESDLHAWVDGQLPEDRRQAVAAAAAADGELAAQAEAWRAQNKEIQALFGAAAAEPVPDRLRPQRIAAIRKRRRWLVPLAASVVWLAVGLAGGWLAHERLGGGAAEEATRHVASRAVSAYRVYAGEVLHPVEVFADQEAHLVKWLSKRLDRRIRTPDLTPLGYRLVGGRLLPAEGGAAAAQFMYEDASGRRVTVYASQYESGQETAFRYREMNGVGAFIWLDPDMGYAIAGEVPREPLLEISKVVYETFDPTH